MEQKIGKHQLLAASATIATARRCSKTARNCGHPKVNCGSCRGGGCRADTLASHTGKANTSNHGGQIANATADATNNALRDDLSSTERTSTDELTSGITSPACKGATRSGSKDDAPNGHICGNRANHGTSRRRLDQGARGSTGISQGSDQAGYPTDNTPDDARDEQKLAIGIDVAERIPPHICVNDCPRHALVVPKGNFSRRGAAWRGVNEDDSPCCRTFSRRGAFWPTRARASPRPRSFLAAGRAAAKKGGGPRWCSGQGRASARRAWP